MAGPLLDHDRVGDEPVVQDAVEIDVQPAPPLGGSQVPGVTPTAMPALLNR